MSTLETLPIVYLAMCGCIEGCVLGAYDNIDEAYKHAKDSPCKPDPETWEGADPKVEPFDPRVEPVVVRSVYDPKE